MKEITEIDMNKYLVLKWSDIDTELSPNQRITLKEIINTIAKERTEHGKKEHDYLVLNMDDDIDVFELIEKIEDKHGSELYREGWSCPQKHIYNVKEIAIDLVNAILKTK